MTRDQIAEGLSLRDDDRAALLAIATADDDRTRVRLLMEYWRDEDRAQRTPRGTRICISAS